MSQHVGFVVGVIRCLVRSQANCARHEQLCPDRPHAEVVPEQLFTRLGGSPRLVFCLALASSGPLGERD